MADGDAAGDLLHHQDHGFATAKGAAAGEDEDFAAVFWAGGIGGDETLALLGEFAAAADDVGGVGGGFVEE